jgi:hypothetical protein
MEHPLVSNPSEYRPFNKRLRTYPDLTNPIYRFSLASCVTVTDSEADSALKKNIQPDGIFSIMNEDGCLLGCSTV